MDQPRHATAQRIARSYPVPSDYVYGLLEMMSEDQAILLLRYYSSVGQFPSLDTLRGMLQKGLGWKK